MDARHEAQRSSPDAYRISRELAPADVGSGLFFRMSGARPLLLFTPGAMGMGGATGHERERNSLDECQWATVWKGRRVRCFRITCTGGMAEAGGSIELDVEVDGEELEDPVLPGNSTRVEGNEIRVHAASTYVNYEVEEC